MSTKTLVSEDFTFVTHADYKYASRLIALIESLIINKLEFNLLIVCHDETVKQAIENLKLRNIETVLLRIVEKEFPQLLVAKHNRSHKEYIFCLTPFVIEFTNRKYRRRFTIYLDADLYFFSDPNSAISSISQDNLVTMVPHRFSKENQHLEFFGTYNVGWIAFKYEARKNDIVEWWMARCLESTSISKSHEEIYGDQKYLDKFDTISQRIGVDQGVSHNVAPWNVKNFIEKNPRALPVYYHFSGFQRNRFFYLTNLSNYGVSDALWIHKNIYKPYIQTISKIDKLLKKQGITIKNESNLKAILKAMLKKDVIYYTEVYDMSKKILAKHIEHRD